MRLPPITATRRTVCAPVPAPVALSVAGAALVAGVFFAGVFFADVVSAMAVSSMFVNDGAGT
jgi:hypothetical protein